MEMEFKEESLSTNSSQNTWKTWQANDYQPNFRANAKSGELKISCGTYFPKYARQVNHTPSTSLDINHNSHDTVGMIANNSDSNRNVRAGRLHRHLFAATAASVVHPLH